MLGITHQYVGYTGVLLFLLTVAPPVYQPATVAAIAVSAYLASQIPDLDQPTASLWRKIPLGRVAGEIVDSVVEHRNFTHSLFGLALFSWASQALIGQFPANWGINGDLLWRSTILVFALHLLADMFTERGIPLLWPYKRGFGIPPEPLAGIRIETGKWFEKLVLLPVLNIILLALVVGYWGNIRQWFV